ncbi:hypothetical protein P168DRAFT_280430 [Aspergillus campestris IBT 28561]|uniref:Uncharacterized protein n=1 Tax=Aspergillus campestris (strain IBT 28561) TaxID=1392248 RepID=A0A2I1D6J4_ASPC2|nr:uncharacterized protein P168DRAFT_280430 [Aspergillus campestris IBT 28561]PKY05502.1 hypothetical protein P168DRAFT_280430 [Aspergillus campestris IBT 28561]
MPPEEVLNGFNDVLVIKDAYSWEKSKILSFMRHVVMNPHLYDIDYDERPAIQKLVHEVYKLCPPDGTSFAGPHMEPYQPTKRILNPEWAVSLEPTSKFIIDPVIYKDVPFSGLFDLLGAFLSIKAAPISATASNFYLPLVGMFDMWCSALCKPWPIMVNCTWVDRGEGKGNFFLGASCAGYKTRHNPSDTGTWGSVVRESRWNLINDDTMRGRGYSMYDCPQTRAGRGICVLASVTKQESCNDCRENSTPPNYESQSYANTVECQSKVLSTLFKIRGGVVVGPRGPLDLVLKLDSNRKFNS